MDLTELRDLVHRYSRGYIRVSGPILIGSEVIKVDHTVVSLVAGDNGAHPELGGKYHVQFGAVDGHSPLRTRAYADPEKLTWHVKRPKPVLINYSNYVQSCEYHPERSHIRSIAPGNVVFRPFPSDVLMDQVQNWGSISLCQHYIEIDLDVASKWFNAPESYNYTEVLQELGQGKLARVFSGQFWISPSVMNKTGYSLWYHKVPVAEIKEEDPKVIVLRSPMFQQEIRDLFIRNGVYDARIVA